MRDSATALLLALYSGQPSQIRSLVRCANEHSQALCTVGDGRRAAGGIQLPQWGSAGALRVLFRSYLESVLERPMARLGRNARLEPTIPGRPARWALPLSLIAFVCAASLFFGIASQVLRRSSLTLMRCPGVAMVPCSCHTGVDPMDAGDYASS